MCTFRGAILFDNESSFAEHSLPQNFCLFVYMKSLAMKILYHLAYLNLMVWMRKVGANRSLSRVIQKIVRCLGTNNILQTFSSRNTPKNNKKGDNFASNSFKKMLRNKLFVVILIFGFWNKGLVFLYLFVVILEKFVQSFDIFLFTLCINQDARLNMLSHRERGKQGIKDMQMRTFLLVGRI